MKPKKRQKLCQNCEGEIDVDVIVCPYCAADLREEKPERQIPPYTPPVRNLHSHPSQESLYPSQSQSAEEADPVAPADTVSASGTQEKNILLPTLLFALGVQLCLLGVLMLLFSHKGSLILHWDARFWFLYIATSIPFLWFGYRSIVKLD